MPQYVALLRGINVGGHRVKMARLRELFEELGFSAVSTVLASGNVVFTADTDDVVALTAEIEEHLEQQLGYGVPCFLRSPAELEEIGSATSPEASSASHYVIFLDEAASESLRSTFADLSSDADKFGFAGREIHWRIQGKMSESPLFGDSRLDRATRSVPTTMRNINTVRRLVAKTGAP